MKVGSLFSGIGGFDLGLERAGHTVVFQCEKDEYRRRVLKRHWPEVPCWEDVVHLRESAERAIAHGIRPTVDGGRGKTRSGLSGDPDLLCGGFPCQDLSVAGRRAGLQGERSSLFFEFAGVADALLPDGGWILIENVPGLLSSHGGRDFAVLLATLAEFGFHDLAWRVLDSRYLGVPQRRRRVFILARRARGRRASEVLLEPESGGGDFEAGEAKGQGSPASLGQGVAGSLGKRSARSHTELDGHGAYVSASSHPDRVRAPSGVPGRVDGGAVAIEQIGRKMSGGPEVGQGWRDDGSMYSLDRAGRHGVMGAGESTDRSALDPKPDGPRYAACGDAVTVQVAEWVGRRL